MFIVFKYFPCGLGFPSGTAHIIQSFRFESSKRLIIEVSITYLE